MPGMPPAGLFAAHPMHSRFGGYLQGLASKLITLAANIDAGQCRRGERAHGGHEGGGIVIERLARFCFTSKHRNASGSISSRTETVDVQRLQSKLSSIVGRSDFMSMSGLPASSLSIPCRTTERPSSAASGCWAFLCVLVPFGVSTRILLFSRKAVSHSRSDTTHAGV